MAAKQSIIPRFTFTTAKDLTPEEKQERAWMVAQTLIRLDRQVQERKKVKAKEEAG